MPSQRPEARAMYLVMGQWKGRSLYNKAGTLDVASCRHGQLMPGKRRTFSGASPRQELQTPIFEIENFQEACRLPWQQPTCNILRNKVLPKVCCVHYKSTYLDSPLRTMIVIMCRFHKARSLGIKEGSPNLVLVTFCTKQFEEPLSSGKNKTFDLWPRTRYNYTLAYSHSKEDSDFSLFLDQV